MKKWRIISVITAFISIALIITGFYLEFNPQPVNKIKPKIINKEEQEETVEETPYNNPLPSFIETYNNTDIKAILEIPQLSINSLVTKSTDNTYYLTNSLYKEQDNLGVPFIDYRIEDINNAKQINIYGHNTENQKYFDVLPFKKLESFLSQENFNNIRDIYLSTDQKKIHYEIIGIKIINDANNEHMRISFRDNNDFKEHTNKLLTDTLYKIDNLEIKETDKIIVLQVCNFNPIDTYLLVIGKEMKA